MNSNLTRANNSDMLGLGRYTSSDSKENPLSTKFLSPHFFSASHLPTFGQNWMDHFIPDKEMQKHNITSKIVRNIVMLQSIYLAKVYRDLLKYKLSYAKNKAKEENSKVSHEDEEDDDIIPMKVGIIGWGQLGTMILTKLLEIMPHFQGMKIYVSTRQPHLLKEFKQEFNISVFFNNEKIARKCDLIFLCWLPFQGDIVLREMRQLIEDRNYVAVKDKSLNKPVIISTLAAIGIPKLKILATEEAVILRTNVNVATVREEVTRTQSMRQLQPAIKEDLKQESPDNSEGEDNITESEQKQETENRIVEYTNEETQNNDYNESIVPEFIILQASKNLIKNLDDLFNIFDAFQSTFYSGESQLAMESNKDGDGSSNIK